MNTQSIENKKENEEFEKVLKEIGFYKKTGNSEKNDMEVKNLIEDLFELGYFF